MDISPITTLTVNPAIDHIFTVDTLTLYNKNLIKRAATFYGGKGINVAYALGKLHSSCMAAGFIGLEDLAPLTQKLASVSVNANFIAVPGNTRANYKVMDIQMEKDTEFNQTGFLIEPEDLAKLNDLLTSLWIKNQWLAISGSLPAGADAAFYPETIRMAAQAGMKTCLDTSGEALRAGAAAKPTLLRVNHSELEEALGKKLDVQADIIAGMRELIDSGIEMVVVSMGKQGVIGCKGSETWSVSIPEVNVTSLTGAGDTLTAGCLHCLIQGKPFSEMLKFGSALATASTLKAEPGDFDLHDLNEILKQTKLKEL
jgi:1-phosphofructokinase family hexose kinase